MLWTKINDEICIGAFFVNSDVQIVNEVMLEDINNILNAGDVPNLYAPEDLDAIMQACRWASVCD